jgi:hypothetical protein
MISDTRFPYRTNTPRPCAPRFVFWGKRVWGRFFLCAGFLKVCQGNEGNYTGEGKGAQGANRCENQDSLQQINKMDFVAFSKKIQRIRVHQPSFEWAAIAFDNSRTISKIEP